MRRIGIVALLILIAVTPALGDINAGKQIYQQNCFCHGEKGDGLKSQGVDFSSSQFWARESDEEIKEVIKNGKDGMPSFSSLTDAQVSDVIEYMKTLAGQAPQPTPTSTPSPTPTPSQTPTPAPTGKEEKKQPGFELSLAIAGLFIAMLVIRKRN